MNTLHITDNDYQCDLQAPCFQALNPEEINLIKDSRTLVSFRTGDNITKQGSFASYILFVISGVAAQYVESEGGKNYNLRIIRPGEFVGLSSVFSMRTFDYSSRALNECQAILIEKSAIAKVINNNGAFGLGLFKRYAEKNAILYNTLQTVMYKQINGRLAKALLDINKHKAEVPEIFQLLSRRDLAEFAGISTESAVKLLKSFQKDELIKLDGKDISILKKSDLEDVFKRG